MIGYTAGNDTECKNDNDMNYNYMLDSFEADAPKKGQECRRNSDCSSTWGANDGFCDSFIGYKCSKKCTENTQCVEGYICRTDGRCAPKVFESVWVVSNFDTTIRFPGGSGIGCNYTIDWGDGSESELYTTCTDYIEHIYTTAGEYHIKVTGVINNWTCDNALTTVGHTDGFCGPYESIVSYSHMRYYLSGVISFGSVQLGERAFVLASELTHLSSIDIPLIGNSMNGCFMYAYVFNSDIGNWDTSNVSDMHQMFWSADSFNQDIGNWDTSHVSDMGSMFYGADSFNQDISNWDTYNVSDMGWMFMDADSFNQDISRWNTSNVIDMASMFWGASSFNQNLANWNVNKVANDVFFYSSMFRGSGFSINGKENWKKMKAKTESGWSKMDEGELGLPTDW
jgi:surface protein